MIEIIKNILPNEINNKIISYLVHSHNWRIAKDLENFNFFFDLETSNKDLGFFLQTYDEQRNINLDTPLNIYAEVIYEIIKKFSKYKFIKPIRFYWNYYNQSSCASLHNDSKEKNHVSFIYNLNDNNGGTLINNEFYKSNAGEAIVFKSDVFHSSVQHTDVKSRFNLNCIVEIERNI